MSSTSPGQQLRAYVDYLRDLGVYDLYRRDTPTTLLPDALRERLAAANPADRSSKPGTLPDPGAPSSSPALSPAKAGSATQPTHVSAPSIRPITAVGSEARSAPVIHPTSVDGPEPPAAYAAAPTVRPDSMPKPPSFDTLVPLPTQVVPAADRAAALEALRNEIGDCTRCPLAYAGRHTIVFADGDPNARLMFVGEGPGADEDASGTPFVGKAGQLLNNMIAAMGLRREQVYIANIVKCRPPGNRTPEFVEATTCSQFLLKQIDIVRPEVIVALGATAATYLLGVKQSLASLRGQWHTARGAKVAVTYHPAFLLRDPRQKAEAWKDLQRVMAEMNLAPPKRPS